MKKYYRLVRRYYHWFGKDTMPIWVLPILVPIGTVAALASVLVAALFFIGAIIVVPIDYTLDLFNSSNKALVEIIEKVFL